MSDEDLIKQIADLKAENEHLKRENVIVQEQSRVLNAKYASLYNLRDLREMSEKQLVEYVAILAVELSQARAELDKQTRDWDEWFDKYELGKVETLSA